MILFIEALLISLGIVKATKLVADAYIWIERKITKEDENEEGRG